MIKISLFTLFTAALALFPVNGSATIMNPATHQSHVRCGVMGKYEINVPLSFQNVTTEMETVNPVAVCDSKMKKLEMKLKASDIQTVSADNWVRKTEIDYSLILKPTPYGPAVKTSDMIKKLYSRRTYATGNDFPSQAPERHKGLVYIKGSDSNGDGLRDDFYLKSDKQGTLNYMIHCMVDGSKGGRCTMAFSPYNLDLNVVVTLDASDVDNYEGIADQSKIIVRTLIKDQGANDAKPQYITSM